jgi:hypothetical protein
MTDKARRVFEDAVLDKEFHGDLVKNHQGHDIPDRIFGTMFWGDLKCNIFAVLYMGWLVGKGRYDHQKYQLR